MNKLVEIRNLFVGYENKPNVLKNINLTVYDDDFWVSSVRTEEERLHW